MDTTITAPRAEVLRDRRRSRLPERLEELAGPVEGNVDLPLQIVWSGRTSYSLDRPKSRMTPYRTVLAEGLREDLLSLLHHRQLTEQWPVLGRVATENPAPMQEIVAAKPQPVFVHDMGGLRDAETERRQWLGAPATGARRAGHAESVSALTQDWLADTRFADYSVLLTPRGAQGGVVEGKLHPPDEDLLSGLLDAMVEELAERFPPETSPRKAGSSDMPGTISTSSPPAAAPRGRGSSGAGWCG
jgi:hypothetical protein